jgi:hypothetical protein
LNSSKAAFGKVAREANQGRPEPPMYVGDFAAEDSTDQDVGAVSNCARQCEDFPTLRVRPPTSADRAAGNSGRQCRYRADRGSSTTPLVRTNVRASKTVTAGRCRGCLISYGRTGTHTAGRKRLQQVSTNSVSRCQSGASGPPDCRPMLLNA